ncbi:hypothetical protein ABEB36_010936 [Hypothenemus hampei]|uniref:F-box domain-containing protein n=1 Tax=Hypothenemus hampei TaxID=57062 RepID=A0ABD1EFK1_HYPHA
MILRISRNGLVVPEISQRLFLSHVLVRPLGRPYDQKPYRYQDNPFGAEYFFTFRFLGQINTINFKMHPSWEEANVVVRIWGACINHHTLKIKGKWHLLYETSHSKDPSKNYKESSHLITAIRIEFNKNLLMYPWIINTLLAGHEFLALSDFPLVLPLEGKVLYEGVQTFTGIVVPEKEPEKKWNEKNFTETLPTEIMYNIFGCLDLRSLSRCAQVNERWNSIASDLHFYQEVDLKVYWDKINRNNLEKLKNKLQIVRKLDMSWSNDATLIRNNEYDDSITSILEGAKDTLTHLCLNHTRLLSEKTMQQIFECPNLNELRLRSISSIFEGFSISCNKLMELKILDISSSSLEILQIIEILENIPNLEHLVMDDCDWLEFDFDSIITTVVKYNPKLKSWTSSCTFDLKNNSRAYKEFGKLIDLEYLDVTGCEPEPYGSSWLHCLAMNCKKLKRLELGCWNHLTDEDLMPVLTQCKELSHLYLPYTPKITFTTLSMACKNLPNLRHICIFSCEKITKEMVEVLAELYKHVNFYQTK